jgi:hypothetical protein
MRLIYPISLVASIACHTDDNGPTPTDYEVVSADGITACGFGSLPYRVYYPKDFKGETFVIHVSRGGNGANDDRGQLLEYVEGYVKKGYVVVQVDHRFAGSDVPAIATYRGEEIVCISNKVKDGSLSYGGFTGTIKGNAQGFTGHSGGCMEGLEAAGTGMTHGNYFVPEIKAVYGISPAGYDPDQFGIRTTPNGYDAIGTTAIFLAVGEEEKDVNGTGTFMKTDWRFQAFQNMNSDGPRFQAFIKGPNTDHIEVSGDNLSIQAYNLSNSLLLFDTFLKGENKALEIGTNSLPPGNTVELSKKGL